MRFLLNENISGTIIRVLRERGHDVVSAKETLRGASDEEILAKVQLEQRIHARNCWGRCQVIQVVVPDVRSQA